MSIIERLSSFRGKNGYGLVRWKVSFIRGSIVVCQRCRWQKMYGINMEEQVVYGRRGLARLSLALALP